jgi:hypothetical protein
LNKLESPYVPSLIDFGQLVLEKKIFKKISVYFYCFAIISQKGYPLSWNKFESPSPQDDLCQVWLKLAQWFWRKRFKNEPIPFLHICDYLPFEEDLAFYMNKLKFPSSKDNLYQV